MSDTQQQDAVIVEPVFPMVVRLNGLPIARLYADGTAEGRIDALETVLASMKHPQKDDTAFRLWIILNALKNQKILR